jgi:hypothetical protein
VPFNAATRQNIIPAPPIAYALGQTGYSNLPKVGLYKRIICLLTGTNTVTLGGGTAALGAESPWSMIQRIALVANGNTRLFDVTGFGAMIASLFSAHGFSGFGGRPIIPDTATVPGVANTGFSQANFLAGVAGGANTWNFALEIPLGLGEDWRDPVGLILAAAPDTQLSLEVTWSAALYSLVASRNVPILVTGAAVAAFVGTLTPYVEFFTIPGSPTDYPDLSRIHIWTETGPQAIAANGDQDVVLQRGNTLMRVIHGVFTNSVADDTNVSNVSLRFNQNEVPYSVNRQLQAVLNRKRMVRDLPAGWGYVHDLWNTGTPRDAINTLSLNEIVSRLTLAGATIAGTSDIRTLTQQLVKLTGQATGSA